MPRIVVGAALVAVLGGGVAALVVQPWAGPPRCTSNDLRVTTAGLTSQLEPTIDSDVVLIRVRRQCTLAGQPRLQARRADGSWIDVETDPNPARLRGSFRLGTAVAQNADGIRLDRWPPGYFIELVWVPASRTCTAPDLRISAPRLALPIPHLAQWCGQPTSVGAITKSSGIRFN